MDGHYDVAVVVRPKFDPPKSRRVVPLFDEPYVAINAEAITTAIPEALATIPYIHYDLRSWGGESAQAYIRSCGVTPDLLCDLDSLETIASMVGSGAGMFIVPRWIGLSRHLDKLWISPPIPECSVREICILYSSSTRHPKIVDLLLERLGSEAGALRQQQCSRRHNLQ